MYTKRISHKLQQGISLIELIMFIVIISVGLVGILLVMNQVTRSSADPVLHKQAIAIAESLLEEIELMPFTFCDPNDANAATALSTAGCTAGLSQDVITGQIPNSETRYSKLDPFDNVADYSGFSMTAPGGIFSMTYGAAPAISGLDNYTANVVITRAGTALLGAADDGTALRITVTVTGQDGLPITLDGYRTRYAPNSVP